MSARIPVLKTYKLFIGGAFPRTESGRALAVKSPDGRTVLARACRASRKDCRNAVVAARKACEGWSRRPAANRGQILYRMAELLEQRSSEVAGELVRSTGGAVPRAKREVQAGVDRLIWYAGWADKLTHLFGTVNPVASSHFNFSIPEPTGVVCIIAPDSPSLLGLISLVAPAIVSGNTVVALASQAHPLPAITLAEILATSDLPPGVVNLLTGFRAEIAPTMASHMDVNALVDAAGDPELGARLQLDGAANVKRVVRRDVKADDWFQPAVENPYWMLDTLEIKTTWHPIGS